MQSAIFEWLRVRVELWHRICGLQTECSATIVRIKKASNFFAVLAIMCYPNAILLATKKPTYCWLFIFLAKYQKLAQETNIMAVSHLRLFGGRLGIRTPGSSHYDGFQDRCFRPLSQPSIFI